MSNLDRLIDAVERGEATLSQVADLCIPVWPNGENHWMHVSVSFAYDREDLNAAKALHEALLPGWEWILGPSNAKIYPYSGSPLKSWSGMADNPARAWLLATLRAYRSQQ